MLAVHWTPVNNTKRILKNGITKSKKGLYCFPLTGHKSLDRWWIYFFNQCFVRNRKKYNGIVFRIKKEDMPAYFGSWVGATNNDDFKKEIKDVKSLGQEFKNVLLWRMGEAITYKGNHAIMSEPKEMDKLFLSLAEKELELNNKALQERINSMDFMTYVLEDYQIVLSNSISPDRIIKIMPQGNEYGKVLVKRKKDKFNDSI